MKRALVLSLIFIIGLSALAVAGGPLIGAGIIPTAGAPAVLAFGWDFNVIAIECIKADLTTPNGDWIFGALWTPQVGDNFGYRVGTRILANWTGAFRYDGFGFVIGSSYTGGAIQIYGELDIWPTGLLVITPVIGINFLVGNLIPAAAD